MPVKSDSAKKVNKKPDRDGNIGPNKKLKRSDSTASTKGPTQQQSQQLSQQPQPLQQQPQQQEITMTIPRKKDKDKDTGLPVTSQKKEAETVGANPKDTSDPIPKIPKKSATKSVADAAETDKETLQAAIPRKTSKPTEAKDDNESGSNKGSSSDKIVKYAPATNSTDSTTLPPAATTADQDVNSIKSSKKGTAGTASVAKTPGGTTTTSKKASKSQGGASSSKKKSDKEAPNRPPKIDTKLANEALPKEAMKVKTPIGTAMDTHPFARGSVIEVLHGGGSGADDDWWSDDSDDEEEEVVNASNEAEKKEPKERKRTSVRLCDIIDRVSVGEKKWRYYVHYRDFNRRMDEWVPMERIVSPPSVGNAKARAIKKEEERQKRKQQRLEEKNAEGVNVSAPRASRRRSSTNQGGAVGADASGLPGGEGESETPRRTRLQRKRSFMDDDNTVVASNQPDKTGNTRLESPHDGPVPPVVAAENGIVAIPTTVVTHTTVGEHVVATIPAQELDEHEGLDEASLREHEEVTKVKNVAFVELGPHQMETWYFSPLPKELLSEKGFVEVLYVCEFTFSLFCRKSELQRFQARLPTHLRHPPGNEIYRNGNLAMFEIDGFEERIYCQNLCYIAKLFLDHKTLYFDVDPFLFYVLCEVDNRGFHPVGYYSKEKYSDVGYNLACILTFPSHQRKGYGRFLIAFSYELSKKEEKVGSPEKPMSDLGQQAYKPYWASTIVDFLLNQSGDAPSMSIMDISKKTSIMAEDIVFTLNQLGILKIVNGVYFIAADEKLLQRLAKKFPVKNPRVDPSKLHWTPFLTDVKRDKFSIHNKKPTVDGEETRGSGGFP